MEHKPLIYEECVMVDYTTIVSIPNSVNTHVTVYDGQLLLGGGSHIRPPIEIIAVLPITTSQGSQQLQEPPLLHVPQLLMTLSVTAAVI